MGDAQPFSGTTFETREERGARVERDAVVAWLRLVGSARDDRADIAWAECLFEAADFIEKGEHLKQKASPETPHGIR